MVLVVRMPNRVNHAAERNGLSEELGVHRQRHAQSPLQRISFKARRESRVRDDGGDSRKGLRK